MIKFTTDSTDNTDEDREDTALLALMYEREKEETFPIETTEQILNNILSK